MTNCCLSGEVKRKFCAQITFSNKNVDRGKGLLNDESLFVIEIPQEILIYLHNLKCKAQSDSRSESSYTKFIEAIQVLPFRLVDGPSLNKRISDIVGIAVRECRGTIGRKRQKLLSKVRHIKVGRSEIVQPGPEPRQQNEQENATNESQEVYELEERCSELYSELVKEKENARNCNNRMKNCEAEINLLKEENSTLKEQVTGMEEHNVCQNCTQDFGNRGNTITNVGNRQRQRKVKELKTKAEKALWFLDSYGVTPKCLSLQDNNGQKIQMDMTPGGKTSPKSKYKDLEDAEKLRIKEVLQIMDTFCIGDAAYHALSVIECGLPRSYMVKQCRKDINNQFVITRTPGDLVGAKMSFKDELKRKIKEKVEKGEKGCQRVKISGDGAKISRISNYIVMSFALLSDEKSVMSSKGNHAFAILCGKECYESLAESFKELFEEINSLIAEGEIEILGEKIQLEFYLGGDYKFLLAILGMNAANSIYACIYCKIHKDDRWDMSMLEDHYWNNEMRRTLKEINHLCTIKKNNFGCISPPLLNISIANIRVDELHLLLRITDILERNVIINTIRWDMREDKNKRSNEPKEIHLKALVKAINDCGIPFSVWPKVNETGKKSSGYDWRSLVGHEKKLLLQHLPETFEEVLRPETCSTVKEIWNGFYELYKIISSWQPSEQECENYFKQACDWVNLFLSLKDHEEGYSKSNITPYIHLLVYHVPKFLVGDGSIKIFTGQGVEKTNDVVRGIYHKKCNKHDACKDSLLALKRLDYLADCERQHNQYNKRDNIYWTSTIFERRKRQRIDDEVLFIYHSQF